MFSTTKLISVLIIGCLMQIIDSQNTNAFEINVTITEKEPYIYECSKSEAECKQYISEALCFTLTYPLPNDYNDTGIPKCEATVLRNETSKKVVDWNILMQLPSSVSDQLTVNFTCPTFKETYNYSLTTMPSIYFTPKLFGFSPIPVPFDPKGVTDTDYTIGGQLFYNKTAIKASSWSDPGEQELLKQLELMTVKHEMGRSLFAYKVVKLSNLTKMVKNDDVFVKFILTIPKDHIIKLKIDPSCDVAGLLQFSVRYDTPRKWYHLGTDAIVKLGISDWETLGSGATNNGVTASPTKSTTDLGCITRPAVNTLALSMVISHVLAII